MNPGRFVGFAYNSGDPMTFKVLHCHKYLHKRNLVVHIGVVVLRNLEATGYNSDLAQKSAYFP